MDSSDSKSGTSVPVDQRYALVLLVKEIFSQLDEVADLRRQGHSAEISLLLLREMCSVLKELGPRLQEVYFDTLLSLADSSRVTSRSSASKAFAEASVNAKRRFIKSVRLDLLGEAA